MELRVTAVHSARDSFRCSRNLSHRSRPRTTSRMARKNRPPQCRSRTKRDFLPVDAPSHFPRTIASRANPHRIRHASSHLTFSLSLSLSLRSLVEGMRQRGAMDASFSKFVISKLISRSQKRYAAISRARSCEGLQRAHGATKIQRGKIYHLDFRPASRPLTQRP